MSQPLFGRTASTEDAAQYAQKYKLDFLDLHFRGDEDKLRQAMNALDALGVKYVPNFEGAPVGWIPSAELKADIAKRPGFLGFMLDELDHMQINAHWPVVHYYGYDNAHYLAETVFHPLIGDGDTLVYDFGQYQARVRQAGWNYPRHEIMTWNVPLTQAGARPDRLEFEIIQERYLITNNCRGYI